MFQQKFIRIKDLSLMLSISRATAWRWVHTKKDFPQPIRLSKGITVWSVDDVQEWVLKSRKSINENLN